MHFSLLLCKTVAVLPSNAINMIPWLIVMTLHSTKGKQAVSISMYSK